MPGSAGMRSPGGLSERAGGYNEVPLERTSMVSVRPLKTVVFLAKLRDLGMKQCYRSTMIFRN